MSNQTIAIGTEKGGFLLTRSEDDWSVEGPLFPGWKVTAFATTADGTTLTALASNWFGASVHRSTDREEWEQAPEGPAYPEGWGRSLDQIWTLTATSDHRVFAGVAEAGLFRSDDAGRTWSPVNALNDHPDRGAWFPGLGGLCAHHVLVNGERIWVAISAVGVWRSDDGGDDWVRCDSGVTPTVDESLEEVTVPGYCVHGLAQDREVPERMWRQDHTGIYRSEDAGDTWLRCEEGLPASFGFPMLRDPSSGRLFVVPLASDGNRLPPEGAFCAYRSDDGGEHWEVAGTGWPESPTYTAVLRNAAAADGLGGIYLGTSGGRVWVSDDAGDSWSELPFTFPRIGSVEVL